MTFFLFKNLYNFFMRRKVLSVGVLERDICNI